MAGGTAQEARTPGFYFLPLEDSIANYQTFATSRRWTTGCLPLFADGGGDFYVVDLRATAVNPLRHFRNEESEHPIEFDSFLCCGLWRPHSTGASSTLMGRAISRWTTGRSEHWPVS
jgi:hypothetical protein